MMETGHGMMGDASTLSDFRQTGGGARSRRLRYYNSGAAAGVILAGIGHQCKKYDILVSVGELSHLLGYAAQRRPVRT
jgi:hypothetical protein